MSGPDHSPALSTRSGGEEAELRAPNPGSDAGLLKGCICPVIVNHYGRGFGAPPKFYINMNCPYHAEDVSSLTGAEHG
jgi:hypothetical protein